jgi:predicted O-methyltransferase YrrM
MSLLIATAEAIPGHVSVPELRWLAGQASVHLRIAELGSWQGRSTRAMADNLPEGGVLYAVDTWDGSNSILQAEVESHSPGWLQGEFARSMGDLLGGKVIPVPLSTSEAAVRFGVEGLQFDMVFIDAGHRYEDVHADILAWRELLTPGALLCGHDYVPCQCVGPEHYPYNCFPGVVRAVDELLPWRELVAGTSIWMARGVVE